MRNMKLFLILSFSALMSLEAFGNSRESDKQALLKFKSQVFEEKKVLLSSWNNSFPLCRWTGVTCSHKHKRVTGLDLGGFQLGGVISSFIGNLSFLTSLDFNSNSFAGTIPQELRNLFRPSLTQKPFVDDALRLQHLNMSFNFLGGGIPASLFNCSRLLDLSLYSNHLGQGLPSEVGSLRNLVTLDLGKNNLNGKIPVSLGNLTSVRLLSFDENNMEGEIPDAMARLTQMVVFAIHINQFSGVFPPAIYNLSSLQSLDMFGNGFSGNLRPDFGNLLPNLEELSLGNNSLTGAIPSTLANISTLQFLAIERNSLTGSIPPSFSKLRYLQLLDLNHNSLGSFSAGDLEFLVSLTNCTQLQSLDVAFNRLGGDLPISIVNLPMNLNDLSLHKNSTSGSIPHDIGNLIGLQTFWFSENLLKGPIPTSFGKLLGLVELSVHANRMSGEIPYSLGNITRLEKLLLSNNSFEGIIPPSLVIDVASVLEYLHISCHEAIAHCDLKPSNVLLDDDLTAHVSDFGLARILLKYDQETFIDQLSSAGVRGSIGYAAPESIFLSPIFVYMTYGAEYAMGGEISVHGDAYSFGILILELFSGKRPTDEMFGGDFTIRSCIRSALPGQVLDVADESIPHSGLRIGFPAAECLTKVLEVGLGCSEESPANRLEMSEVVKELISIKERFFKARRGARH
ncbi:hypothetical protein F2Q68_00032719 [Brassica cretica]|uniref:non-specific serine/threonine protein kinase n=1 Tax=Brassica cretica TaxID=69181 RepID=A0A8S9GBG9_BRACR|nr:hypothetical protein F2Q68_00032719 [Brassica cretica]